MREFIIKAMFEMEASIRTEYIEKVLDQLEMLMAVAETAGEQALITLLALELKNITEMGEVEEHEVF